MMRDGSDSSRRIPRQHRSRQTVEAVLAAVPLVVKRHGASSVTTNRIAEVAGVSIGSLYQYFPDKKSVFCALQERHIDDVRETLKRNAAGHESSDFSEFVVDLVEDLIDLHSVDTEVHQLVTASVSEEPEHFRFALRSTLEQSLARCGSKSTNRILFVLPHLIEGVVHGAALSPCTSREVKGEAVKVTLAYLSAHPELGR